MPTQTKVIIKGENNISSAVKSASNDLNALKGSVEKIAYPSGYLLREFHLQLFSAEIALSRSNLFQGVLHLHHTLLMDTQSYLTFIVPPE